MFIETRITLWREGLMDLNFLSAHGPLWTAWEEGSQELTTTQGVFKNTIRTHVHARHHSRACSGHALPHCGMGCPHCRSSSTVIVIGIPIYACSCVDDNLRAPFVGTKQVASFKTLFLVQSNLNHK